MLDLSQLKWTVEGWREWDWMLGESNESGTPRIPDVAPVPVAVPGSVRGALVRAGLVPDPLFGAHSRESEFIENRHWIFRTRLPRIDLPEGATERFHFESLDGRGEIHLGGRQIGQFDNPFVPTVVTVAARHELDANTDLAVIFHTPPTDLGQVGWTSRRRSWKPRFNYGWDWTPRIVQTAISGTARLDVVTDGSLETVYTRVRFDQASRRGGVEVTVRALVTDPDAVLQLDLFDGDRVIATVAESAATGRPLRLQDIHVAAWDPGSRSPKLYSVRVTLVARGVEIDHCARTIGFREVAWEQTEGAPEDAEPWLCSVNGTPIFLQGVNWVPIRPDYADVPDSEYRSRLEAYRTMGVNVLRVWGGAAIERSTFYDLCDQLGLLVWQELPLCSSGIDNYPADDPKFANEFGNIAASYGRRLSHHPCIIVWGGGNELAGHLGEMDMDSSPLTFDHPALAAAKRSLIESGVDAKIVPTSPSGPAFFVDPSQQNATGGRGLHHDVHGPWALNGSDADWDRYWAADDAMLRSETGMAGASSRDVLEQFGLWVEGERPVVWDHSSAWWITDERCTDESIDASQARQARRLATAARASKDRYPACAGFLVWMGHDSFPCAVSLALLDVHGRRKPAADALSEVFHTPLPARTLIDPSLPGKAQ